ncbi:MAG TPA: hypothetical protein VFA97_00815 [Gaiellaceae bacterium]|nr:hypothetical protein [Gaiellaceae bacterium]
MTTERNGTTRRGTGPYYFLGRRPFREARLRAYLVREHRLGRRLHDILKDDYVKRCGNERFCRSVAQDPTTLALLEENVREFFRDSHP